jgi:hypothetical protein
LACSVSSIASVVLFPPVPAIQGSLVFFHVERWRLAGRPYGNDGAGAVLNLEFDEPAEAFLVHFPFHERRHDRHNGSFEHNQSSSPLD